MAARFDAKLGAGQDPLIESRLWVLMLGVLCFVGIFETRLFYLQVIRGDELRQRSEKNSIRTLRLEAPRGEVVDRDGKLLATTRPAFDVRMIPSDVQDLPRELAALGELLELDPAPYHEKLSHLRGRARFQPVPIAMDISFEHLARVETHRLRLPGVLTEVVPRRHYLEGELAAHVLGKIGEIHATQLEKPEFQSYVSGEIVGQSGVEAMFEPQLRGKAGGRNVVVDVVGREVELLDEVPASEGGRVRLALDLDLQRVAEAAFLDVPEGEPAKMGALVALDPRNGDVLALVSKPAYDPNDFAGGVDTEVWSRLMSDEWRPLQHRALKGQYPPGSTYKAFVAAAALEEKVVTQHTTVYCPGYYRLGNRRYGCWKKEGHGSVDLHKALQQSCDVYFYTVGNTLTIDRIARFSRAFGLGGPTKIIGVTAGEEKEGLIPTEAWKERRFGQKWIAGETISAAIGQGYNLVTPIQLAVAYAAIANGGQVVRPRLVLEAIDREGKVQTFAPEVGELVPVSAKNLAAVRAGLEAVVEEPGGTGGRSRVPGVRVAGKTGTAQVVRLERTKDMKESEVPIKYRDHAWFVAYAPAENAEIVVAVLAEHGGHGGSAAAPIAQRVLARYFEKKLQQESVSGAATGSAPVVEANATPAGPGPAPGVVSPARRETATPPAVTRLAGEADVGD